MAGGRIPEGRGVRPPPPLNPPLLFYWSENGAFLVSYNFCALIGRGEFGEEGGGAASCPTQRVPLCTFLKYLFWLTDLKIFLKASSAPIYTNFEGGARAEKTQFFGLNFPKVPKTPFLACLFKILPAVQEFRPK